MKKADEDLNGEQKAVPKFERKHSLMHNSKGRTNLNSSSPIHSVCTITITTQEGSNAAQEWNHKRHDSRESSTKKKNTSRKNRWAHTRKKREGTSEAIANKLDSLCPTPEALVNIELR